MLNVSGKDNFCLQWEPARFVVRVNEPPCFYGGQLCIREPAQRPVPKSDKPEAWWLRINASRREGAFCNISEEVLKVLNQPYVLLCWSMWGHGGSQPGRAGPCSL